MKVSHKQNGSHGENLCFSIYFCLLFFFIILHAGCLFLTGLLLGDGDLRWKESSYVFSGINPFEIINGIREPLSEIGWLPDFAGAVPWGLILGNLFTPCFLSHDAALNYTLTLYFVLVPIAVIIFARFLHSNGYIDSKRRSLCVALGILALGSLYHSYWVCNYGALICMFIIIAISICDKHEYVAGILMAFAMCKPQLGFLFFFPFLLMGKWRLIFTSVFITFAAWGIAISLTHTEPLQLFTEMLAVGKHIGLAGFFTFPFVSMGFSPTAVRLCSMVFSATLYVLILYYTGLSLVRRDFFFHVSCIAVLCGMWFYMQEQDYLILILPFVYLYSNKAITPTVLAIILVCAVSQELFAVSRYLKTNYPDDSLLTVFRHCLFFGSIVVHAYGMLFVLYALVKACKRRNELTESR